MRQITVPSRFKSGCSDDVNQVVGDENELLVLKAEAALDVGTTNDNCRAVADGGLSYAGRLVTGKNLGVSRLDGGDVVFKVISLRGGLGNVDIGTERVVVLGVDIGI